MSAPKEKSWLFWLIVLLTLVMCVGIALDATPWLRGAEGQYEWRWRYDPVGFVLWRLIVVAAMVGLLAGWYGLAWRRERVGAWLLAVLVPLSVALQLSVLASGTRGLQLVARVLNPGYFGYYPPATEVADLGHFLDTYAREQPVFSHPRMKTHPPGNVVFHWLVLQGVKAVPSLTELTTPLIEPRLDELPDWIHDYAMTDITGAMVVSLLIPIVGASAVIPLFLLARAGFGEETARRTAVLYLLAPSLTLFEPKIDVLYTLLSSGAFLLAYSGVRRDRLWLLYLSGLICSAGTFMSYSLIPLTLATGLFVVATALAGWRKGHRRTMRRLVARCLIFGIGALSIQAGTRLIIGFDPVQAFRAMLSSTAPYNVARNYWYSLIYTPYDLLLFAGIPVAALLVRRVVRLARTALRREQLAQVDWVLIGTLVAMGALVLTGIQKAENARVFLYTMPVVVLFGAAESDEVGLDWRAFAAVAVLTFLQLMVFQGVLEVYL